jgi:hypothetical protein
VAGAADADRDEIPAALDQGLIKGFRRRWIDGGNARTPSNRQRGNAGNH